MFESWPEALRELLDPPDGVRAHPRRPRLLLKERQGAGAGRGRPRIVDEVVGDGRWDWALLVPGGAEAEVLWADGRDKVLRIAHADPEGGTAPLLRASWELRQRLLRHPLVPHAERVEVVRTAPGWSLRIAAAGQEQTWGSGEAGDAPLETPWDVETRVGAFITRATGWRVQRCGECGGTRAYRPRGEGPPPPCGTCGAATPAWRCGGCGSLFAEPRAAGGGLPACGACRDGVFVAGTWPWAWRRQTRARLDAALGGLCAAATDLGARDLARASGAARGLYRLAEAGPGAEPEGSAVRRLLAPSGEAGALGALVLGAWGLYRPPDRVASAAVAACPARTAPARAAVLALLGSLVPFHLGHGEGPHGPAALASGALALGTAARRWAPAFAGWLAEGAAGPLPPGFEVEALAWSAVARGEPGGPDAREASVVAAYLRGALAGARALADRGGVEAGTVAAMRGAAGRVLPPEAGPGEWFGYALRAWGEEIGLGPEAGEVARGR